MNRSTFSRFTPVAVAIVVGLALGVVLGLAGAGLRLLSAAFPASPGMLLPAAAWNTPAQLGRPQTDAFLARRASREERGRRGHWSLASAQLAV